jgi:hypothetical protein
MKLIPSLAYQGQVTVLKQENDQLRTQLARITEERDRLQDRLQDVLGLAAPTAPLGGAGAGSDSHPIPPNALAGHSASSPAAVGKSYLKATKASLARAGKLATSGEAGLNSPPLRAQFGNDIYTYKDGKISEPGFLPPDMQPTNSSRWEEYRTDQVEDKASEKETTEEEYRGEDGESAGGWSATASPTLSPTLSSDGSDYQPEAASSGTASLSDTSHTIPPPRPPRLLTYNWIQEETALSACFSDDGRAFDYVEKAWTLAREALWDWAQQHHPKLFEHLSSESSKATMIRAGSSELRTHLAPEIAAELQELPKLRNYMAHPSNLEDLSKYDKMAQIAENLVAVLRDNARLDELVEARDSLRKEPDEIMAEIAEIETVAELQGDYVEGTYIWQKHHTALFDMLLALEKTHRDTLKLSHPVAAKAVERWGDVNAVCRPEDKSRLREW